MHVIVRNITELRAKRDGTKNYPEEGRRQHRSGDPRSYYRDQAPLREEEISNK